MTAFFVGTFKSKMKITLGIIYSFGTFVLNLACFVFVVYQAQKCTNKFIESPKTTDVAMQKASKFPYPAITVCHNTKKWRKIYSETLVKCNLT